MREFLNVLGNAMSNTMIVSLVITLGIASIRESLNEMKRAKQKQLELNLAKRKDEIDAKLLFKKRKFEEYKSYIESLNFDEQVDIKEVNEDSLTLEEGVTKLVKETHHTYRPYEVNSFDIRDTLREFTVQDVLNTFYI